jgi:hypothetical protein
MRTVDNEGQPGKLATFNSFARGFLSGELKLTVLSNTVYVGCVTETSFTEDKAQRFLSEIRTEFSKMYQGRLSLIKKQSNLTANVYDQPFKKSFQKVLDNFNTGISNKNL